MTKITGFDTFDVRFPTSRTLAGSDAMNAAPDYSAAYVVIRTDAPEAPGASTEILAGTLEEYAYPSGRRGATAGCRDRERPARRLSARLRWPRLWRRAHRRPLRASQRRDGRRDAGRGPGRRNPGLRHPAARLWEL
ncbi:MAG: hypothetical protein ACLP8X_43035 [Streptosporangiaceae bacterium]